MLNSNERMGFIIEYMSSYDEKIKMANKNGLFDAAKMFELFAIEVCNVWFGQKFSNLNDETATYPYVDLISENRELFSAGKYCTRCTNKNKNYIGKDKGFKR
ncbi:hypothetical protein DW723_15510 [Blautia obeum]|uniref:SMEK domain-containing protein n=1 Tax=Blautia obeum TaxID=40520 RepID=A0A414K6Y9_9FIRM|nr:hypothetical protein DW723_15510 [Blautia obeum]